MDYLVFRVINNLSGHVGFLDAFMVAMATTGPYILMLVTIILWFRGKDGSERNKNRRFFVYAVVAGALGIIFDRIISGFYYRPRPFVVHHVHRLIPHPADSSFPSEHVTGSFALAASVARGNPLLGKVMYLLAVIIAIARVYVGVHYPLDVLGGAIIGITASFIVAKLHAPLEPLVKLVLGVWERLLSLGRGVLGA